VRQAAQRPAQAAAAADRPQGNAGPCQCPTSLTSHQVISISNLSALEAETHFAMAPDGTMASVWISISGGGGSDIGYVFSTDSERDLVRLIFGPQKAREIHPGFGEETAATMEQVLPVQMWIWGWDSI